MPPPDYLARLDPPPDVGVSDSLDGTFDWIQVFVRTSADLAAIVEPLVAALSPTGIAWISYPKGSSKIQTDLTRDKGWEPLQGSDLMWLVAEARGRSRASSTSGRSRSRLLREGRRVRSATAARREMRPMQEADQALLRTQPPSAMPVGSHIRCKNRGKTGRDGWVDVGRLRQTTGSDTKAALANPPATMVPSGAIGTRSVGWHDPLPAGTDGGRRAAHRTWPRSRKVPERSAVVAFPSLAGRARSPAAARSCTRSRRRYRPVDDAEGDTYPITLRPG